MFSIEEWLLSNDLECAHYKFLNHLQELKYSLDKSSLYDEIRNLIVDIHYANLNYSEDSIRYELLKFAKKSTIIFYEYTILNKEDPFSEIMKRTNVALY
jgi:hypothetical protein